MSLKDVLQAKITNQDQFTDLISNEYVPSSIYPTKFATPETAWKASTYDQVTFAPPWWLRREYLRIHAKVYDAPSEVIKYLNKVRPEFALHVSKEDKNYIAYTPDRSSGESDRQLRTTLGRYLSKVWPHLPDSYVQNMVSSHIAELSDEFELLYGQDVVNVYKLAQGPESCMSKSGWDGIAQHPAEVYDAEGIAMAVLRDATGRITDRTLVYHASETDKRYIRVYTNPVLAKRLGRAGYVAGAWHGAKFKTIESSNQSNATGSAKTYVFPYLDGMGTAGGSGASTVACIDGVITSIKSNAAIKLNEHVGRIVTSVATNTSGLINLTNVESASFTSICALSGKKMNILEDVIKTYWDGFQMLQVSEDTTEVFNLRQIIYGNNYLGSQKQVYVQEGIPRFPYGSRHYLDTIANRHECGFYKLDEKHYGITDWILPHSGGYVVTDTETHTVIKAADAISVVEMGGLGTPVHRIKHKSELDYTWTKLHSQTKGQPMYATDDVTVVKTLGGRKVVIGIHAVEELWDGTFDFSRNTETDCHYDRTWNYNRKAKPDFGAGGPIWDTVVEGAIAGGTLSHYWLRELLRELMTYTTNKSGQSLRVANYSWNELTDPEFFNYSPELAENVHVAAVLRRIGVIKAEREALDYSISTTLQGAAGSTWAPPPEVPDCNGRIGFAAELYKRLLKLPMNNTADPIVLMRNHGWLASDLTDNHRLRAGASRLIDSFRIRTNNAAYIDSDAVLNDAYAKRLAYYRKMYAYAESVWNTIDTPDFDGEAYEAVIRELDAELLTPVERLDPEDRIEPLVSVAETVQIAPTVAGATYVFSTPTGTSTMMANTVYAPVTTTIF